jgi:hypothetical protein
MSASDAKLRIRPAMASDAAPLCAILNAIIEIGGTTAFEIPLSTAKFGDYFLEGKGVLACFVAEDLATGAPLGFQALSRDSDLPENWADIATFAKRTPGIPGVGTALFAQTRIKASALELIAINAVIRADNRGGLAYYDKMGFETYRIAKSDAPAGRNAGRSHLQTLSREVAPSLMSGWEWSRRRDQYHAWIASSSGNNTTLSCSLGSVREITAVQGSVWLIL